MRLKLPFLAIGVLAAGLCGCGAPDTTEGAAESAAALAKKSENAAPLPAADQAILDKNIRGEPMKKGGN